MFIMLKILQEVQINGLNVLNMEQLQNVKIHTIQEQILIGTIVIEILIVTQKKEYSKIVQNVLWFIMFIVNLLLPLVLLLLVNGVNVKKFNVLLDSHLNILLLQVLINVIKKKLI